jgi:hypothetical protein
MRESALFGTMFGLGAGAVLVGVTVSRLVVGQVPEKSAAEPAAGAAQAPPAVVSSPAKPAPETVVTRAAEPPAQAAVQPQRRALPRKHRRPPVEPSVEEETPAATASVPTASTPNVEAEAAPPSPTDTGDSPVAVVRGGAVRPILGSRGPGARIIQVDPPDGGP